MILDDSATMRKIRMRTLQTAGLEINKTEEAGNNNEALKKLNSNAVDIMPCDVNTPAMSCPELGKKVCEPPACENIKIITVSTESYQEQTNISQNCHYSTEAVLHNIFN